MKESLSAAAVLPTDITAVSDTVQMYLQWYEACRRLRPWEVVVQLLENDSAINKAAEEAVFVESTEGTFRKLRFDDAFFQQRLRDAIAYALAANTCGDALMDKLTAQIDAAEPSAIENVLQTLTDVANTFLEHVPEPFLQLTFVLENGGTSLTLKVDECLFGGKQKAVSTRFVGAAAAAESFQKVLELPPRVPLNLVRSFKEDNKLPFEALDFLRATIKAIGEHLKNAP